MGRWSEKLANRITTDERKEIADFHAMRSEEIMRLLKFDLNLGLRGRG